MLFDVVTSTHTPVPLFARTWRPTSPNWALLGRTSNMLKYMFATPDRCWWVRCGMFDENNTATGNPGFPGSGGPDSAYVMARSMAARGRPGGWLSALFRGFRRRGPKWRVSLRTTLPGGTDASDAWTLGGSVPHGGPGTSNRGLVTEQAKFAAVTSPLVALVRNGWTAPSWASSGPGRPMAASSRAMPNKRQRRSRWAGYQMTTQLNLGAHYSEPSSRARPRAPSNGNADFLVAVADYAFCQQAH